MKHEKEFKLENGDIVKVEVSIWVDAFSTNKPFGYSSGYISIKRKGKRKFEPFGHNSEKYETYIQETKLELWGKLKP